MQLKEERDRSLSGDVCEEKAEEICIFFRETAAGEKAESGWWAKLETAALLPRGWQGTGREWLCSCGEVLHHNFGDDLCAPEKKTSSCRDLHLPDFVAASVWRVVLAVREKSSTWKNHDRKAKNTWRAEWAEIKDGREGDNLKMRIALSKRAIRKLWRVCYWDTIACGNAVEQRNGPELRDNDANFGVFYAFLSILRTMYIFVIQYGRGERQLSEPWVRWAYLAITVVFLLFLSYRLFVLFLVQAGAKDDGWIRRAEESGSEA